MCNVFVITFKFILLLFVFISYLLISHCLIVHIFENSLGVFFIYFEEQLGFYTYRSLCLSLFFEQQVECFHCSFSRIYYLGCFLFHCLIICHHFIAVFWQLEKGIANWQGITEQQGITEWVQQMWLKQIKLPSVIYMST